MAADVQHTIATTLRQIADWGLTWAGNGKPAQDELLDVARQVEQLTPDTVCCPMCSEIQCDDDCALKQARAQPHQGDRHTP